MQASEDLQALADALTKVRLQPRSHRAYQQLSEAYGKENQAELALAAALQAIALEPKAPEAYLQAAAIYRAGNQLQHSKNFLTRCIENCLDNQDAHLSLAIVDYALQLHDLELPPLLTKLIPLMGAKRAMLEKEADGLSTVALGNSHGAMGFNPCFFPGSFNLCCRSQDLKYAALLHEKITATMPQVKNIVLFYSAFSPAFEMEKQPSEKVICPALNELFSLNVNYSDEYLMSIASKIKGKLDHIPVDLTGQSGGYVPTSRTDHNHDYVKDRVFKHLKYSKTGSVFRHLELMLSRAVAHGHRVTIVIPPVRSDFRFLARHSSSHVFRSLLAMANRPALKSYVNVVNLWESRLFVDAHFDDCDHLKYASDGSEILTVKVKESLARR